MGSWKMKVPKIVEVISENCILEGIRSVSQESEIAVVSIFGRSKFLTGRRGFKTAFQLGVDAFGSVGLYNSLVKSGTSSNLKVDKGKDDYTTIFGFYNEEESLLMLSLDGVYDPNVCLHAFSNSSGKGFLTIWSELKSSHSRALILLFSLSHILILSNNGAYFDTTYVMLFRALEIFRLEILQYIRDELKTIPDLPDSWIEHARLCSPRLLFLFTVENIPTTKFPRMDTLEQDALTKLKLKLENELYQIMRKCRIITNVSGQSLFAIPLEQEADFVFLYEEGVEMERDWAGFVLDFCETKVGRLPTFDTKAREELGQRDFVARFRSFLLSHINVALTKGFDDNASRVDERKHFFLLPKLKNWVQVFEKLKEFLLNGKIEESTKLNKILRSSESFDVDTMYLEAATCSKFSKVFSVYMKNIPGHYSEQEHGKRVNQAIDAFLRISRGPGIVPWLEKLTDKCDRFWKRGHQQCATHSLHGHSCINPLHRTEPEENLEVLPHPITNERMSEMKHSTGNRLNSYCNCGRRSGTRDEPFTIREANYDFYQRLAPDCCEKLESWKFPVFEDLREGKGDGLSLAEMLRIFLLKKKEPLPRRVEEEELGESQALERDLRQEEEEEEEEEGVEEGEETREDFGPPPEEQDNPQIQVPLISFIHSPSPLVESGSEYLPGMFHSRCPEGLLPLFPSWSLIRFGSSSLYAHSLGILHQPGFLTGTGFLLPWDVLVKAEAGVMKAMPRMTRGKIPTKRIQCIQDEFTVKVFIGFEYECRKGHRFMLEAPDKVLQMNNPNFGPIVREAAAKVATSDMPLYFKCPCNTQVSGEQMVGQLMRVHVVTPKAPVNVRLNPRVQPDPSPCPLFSPGQREPVKLSPSAYWILRLPYAYVSEEKVYRVHEHTWNGRSLKGLFDVVGMTAPETIHWETTNTQLT